MKFYGQWNPPQDQLLYETYFEGQRNGVFIECGAFDGITESSCYFFEESMGWTGVNIEPVPSVFKLLRVNRPNSININAGLSSREGIAEFTHTIIPNYGEIGNGSFKHSDAHKDYLINIGCQFSSFNVHTITYREMVLGLEMSRLDLFVLDVEGHELEVLAGMEGAETMPRVFCIEHGHLDIEALDLKMTNLGYQKDRLLHNNLVYLKK